MKKIIKNTITALFFLTTLIFTGCTDSVYYNVNNDVPPLVPTMSGTIRAITRYTVGGKEFLVATTEDGIKYKSADGRDYNQWKDYKLPNIEIHHYDYYGAGNHVGHQLLVTHADINTLYLVTVEYTDDDEEGITAPSKINIFAKQVTLKDETTWSEDGEWTSILDNDSGITYTPFYKDSSSYLSAFAIFSTNAVQPAHRKVFLRSGDVNSTVTEQQTPVYYSISGLGAPVALSSVSPVDYSNTEKNNACSAVYFNNEVLFFNSPAVTTNETASSNATMLYYEYDKYIFYKKAGASEFTKSAVAIGKSPASVLSTCKDALIIGRADFSTSSNSSTGGVVKFQLNEDGTLASELGTFTTNIETQLQNAYFILTFLNVDPSQAEADCALYSSIDFVGTGSSSAVKFKEVGLWSYYPERGNWNRE